MTLSRRLQQQARQFADQQSDKSSGGGVRPIVATVSAVSAGGASDGNALVAVRWRDQQVTVAGYAASYTPAVGHRVMCLLVDSQLVIAFRIVGHP